MRLVWKKREGFLRERGIRGNGTDGANGSNGSDGANGGDGWGYLCRRMGLFLPGDVGDAGEVVDVAGKDEEVVTEAIDVVEDYGLDVGTGVGKG